MNYDTKNAGSHGFTVIEVVVVVFALAILFAIVSTSYFGMQNSARNAEAEQELLQFGRAMVRAKSESGGYPEAMNDSWTPTKFTKKLFSENASYNLVYCTVGTNTSYALLAITNSGKRVFITNEGSPQEYTGSVNWLGDNAGAMCGSVLPGSVVAGKAGWRKAGETPVGWRKWAVGE